MNQKLKAGEASKIVARLNSKNRDEKLKALLRIREVPDPRFLAPLLRFEKMESDVVLLSAWVKAVGACDPVEALEILVPFLKHVDERVRSNCIEGLTQSGFTKSTRRVLRLVLNFLSDPSQRVVTACLKALKGHLSQEQLSRAVNDYFDSRKENICLNCLYLVYQLKLQENFYIFESCISHASPRVRSYAKKLLPLFEERMPGVRDLLIRRESGAQTDLDFSLGSSSEHEILSQGKRILEKGEIREKIDYLMELPNLEAGKDEELRRYLMVYLRTEKQNFVLATLVKSLAALKVDGCFEALEPFLKVEDKRVVSNTIEALSNLNDKRLLPYLQSLMDSMDYENREDVRSLSAGIPFLVKHEEVLAVQAMKNFSTGSISAVGAFVRFMYLFEERDGSVIVKSVLSLVEKEIRPDVLFECANYLGRNGSLEILERVEKILGSLESGDKKDILVSLRTNLLRQFGPVDKEKQATTGKGSNEVQKVQETGADDKEIKTRSGIKQSIAEELGVKPASAFEDDKGRLRETADYIVASLVSSPWIIFCLMASVFSALGFLIWQFLDQ